MSYSYLTTPNEIFNKIQELEELLKSDKNLNKELLEKDLEELYKKYFDKTSRTN